MHGFFLPLCKHAVLIPDVFNVIPELLQDTLQDQLLPTEWQLSLPILDAIFISQDAIFNLWFNIIKWCRLQFNHWWDRQQLLRANLKEAEYGPLRNFGQLSSLLLFGSSAEFRWDDRLLRELFPVIKGYSRGSELTKLCVSQNQKS